MAGWTGLRNPGLRSEFGVYNELNELSGTSQVHLSASMRSKGAYVVPHPSHRFAKSPVQRSKVLQTKKENIKMKKRFWAVAVLVWWSLGSGKGCSFDPMDIQGLKLISVFPAEAKRFK
jgi:hypothetical protein